jgi:hypothetical protein
VVIGNKSSPFTQITTVALKITTKITLMPIAAFAEDVGADVQSFALLFCLVD